MRNPALIGILLLPLAVLSPRTAPAQTAPQPIPPTEISADLGTCSALITVTDADSRPIYAAKVATRILPGLLKKPMFIIISNGDRQQTVEFKPELRCHATFDVQLR